MLRVARRGAAARPARLDVSLEIADGRDTRRLSTRELSTGERFVADTVEHEVDAALRTAGLLAENRRRLDQQAALLHAAQVVTSELEIEAVLQRLVEEVTKLLGADAADCYLVDPERGRSALRRGARASTRRSSASSSRPSRAVGCGARAARRGDC